MGSHPHKYTTDIWNTQTIRADAQTVAYWTIYYPKCVHCKRKINYNKQCV